MSEHSLHRRRILVVEDEFHLARAITEALEAAGAVVVGPASTVSAALSLIGEEPRLDAALLDLNLGGQSGLPVGDALSERDVPFLFATGYGQWRSPERFAHVALCFKPFAPATLVEQLARVIAA